MTDGAPNKADKPTHLFDTTFSQVLPAHYEKLKSRWLKIARVHYEASSALLATDRDAGTNSLKAELDMLDHDIEDYRAVVRAISLDDIVRVYLIAGRQKCGAEQIAKEDLQNLESSLHEIEVKVKEMRADVVYGFEEPGNRC